MSYGIAILYDKRNYDNSMKTAIIEPKGNLILFDKSGL